MFKSNEYLSGDEKARLEFQKPYKGVSISPEVMDSIYDLYLQGWTIRDISRRYGILPQRAKFYVWSRAKLYNELLPKHGVKMLFHTAHIQQKFV